VKKTSCREKNYRNIVRVDRQGGEVSIKKIVYTKMKRASDEERNIAGRGKCEGNQKKPNAGPLTQAKKERKILLTRKQSRKKGGA